MELAEAKAAVTAIDREWDATLNAVKFHFAATPLKRTSMLRKPK